MKECFLITTYCDTEEKINALRRTIDELKVYDKDICVHAHYPLPFDLQQSINYYLFDSSNPIIPYETRSIIMWRKFGLTQLNVLKRDYGYTVMSQWRGGLIFLHNIGYEVVHILNYDTDVSNEMMKNCQNIETSSGVFYLNTSDEINLLFATINIKEYWEDILSISREDYINMNEYWYAEGYVYHKFNKNNLYFFDEIEHKGVRHQPYEFEKFDFENFSVHIGQKINWNSNEKKYSGKLAFYFYNVKKLFNLKVYDGFNLKYNIDIEKDMMIDTELKFDDILESFGSYKENKFIEGNNKIKILIDDKKIDKTVTDDICICSIELR